MDPDDDKSAIVASAAARAGARGATREAAVLAGHALRLTPTSSAEAPERVLDLAERLRLVGDKSELTALLTGALDSFRTPAHRVRAHLLLTSGDIEHIDDVRRHLDRALEAAGDDAALRAPVLARMVDDEAVVRLQNVPQAHEWALLAAASTPERADHRVLVRHALAWTQALQGHPVDVPPSDDGTTAHTWEPERIAGQRLVWRGEVHPAREVLTRLLRTADERGAPWAYAMHRLHLCELELRVGRLGGCRRAARRVGRLPGQRAPALADVRAVPGPRRGRRRRPRDRGPVGRRSHRTGGRDRCAVGPVRGAARHRVGGAAPPRARRGRGGPAPGLGALPGARDRGPRCLPGGTRPGRGSRRLR